ncbi:efflux RND transporter periplasmic adaptor subunit [Falsiruegeria mediterranea]|uniref:RND efflux pump membrane fusion protein barrel-sandwich domain-containing protein n=1 Tax=Falsiruegeria mediterranea M17 TaxID=1200281 RepID=A0A2R8CF11_9RHOB|nr:HlyD family efflux transporter periplasmic adaptor subunit [Falsiruegeria mediterranea]SPJ30888.1 hypothetical protein TRM7615_04425 [Falsiruegeria mediterranea M17]
MNLPDPNSIPSTTETTTQTGNGAVEVVSFASASPAWQDLGTRDPEKFGDAWLRLFCSATPEVYAARLLLRRPGEGLARVAEFNSFEDDQLLSSSVEAAVTRKSGVARQTDEGMLGAYPVVVDDRVHAVVAVLAEEGLSSEALLARVRWGAGWLRSFALDALRTDDKPSLERARLAMEMLSGALDEAKFDAAARRAVTEIAHLGQCDRAAVGFRRSGRARVAAISHTAQFGRRMDLVRSVAAAMDEALEQQATLLWPLSDPATSQITRAQQALSRVSDGAQILTIPVLSRGRFRGAFTFERQAGDPFDQPTIDLLEAAAGLTGPILEELRRNDRWLISKSLESLLGVFTAFFGKGHLGLKLTSIVLLGLAVAFSQITTTYRVAADAVLEGRTQRALIAPFDGFVAGADKRAGDVVSHGEILARLDDRDLALERLNWVAERRRAELEYATAVGERNRSRLNILRARIEQADAQLALIDGQIERAEIRAPFDGLIVAGDLSQSIGGSVTRGDALFRIAPEGEYRVALWVDEAQIEDLEVGSVGVVVLAALPTEFFPIEVSRVTPVAEVRNGRNMFRLEAKLEQSSDRMRPGLVGVAKVDAGEKLLIWTWTRNLIDWTRLTFWRFFG